MGHGGSAACPNRIGSIGCLGQSGIFPFLSHAFLLRRKRPSIIQFEKSECHGRNEEQSFVYDVDVFCWQHMDECLKIFFVENKRKNRQLFKNYRWQLLLADSAYLNRI